MRLRLINVPIPPQHVLGLAVGILLQFLLPYRLFSNPLVGRITGLALLMIGVALSAWAVVTVGDADITSKEELITSGPFAHSRNPMYLGWTLLFGGIGLALNGLWFIVLLPLVSLYTHYFDVVPEERALEERFGQRYHSYCRQTRRYL